MCVFFFVPTMKRRALEIERDDDDDGVCVCVCVFFSFEGLCASQREARAMGFS